MTDSDLIIEPEVGQVWLDGIDPVFWKIEDIIVDTVRVRMHLANESPTATVLDIPKNRWRTFVERQAATLRSE